MASMVSFAEATDSTTQTRLYISQGGEVEFFSGVDLNYRDIWEDNPYQFLIRLTPGMKWHMGKHFDFSAQALVPIVNDYGAQYKNVSLNVLNVSKEALLWDKLAVKASIGLFSEERWGVDVKAMMPLNDWFALEGEAGLTGKAATSYTWMITPMNRFFGTIGADFYIPQYNTQFRVYGGRFLNTDNGAVIEAMRHFTHCTVGVYGEYSSFRYIAGGINAGFKVVMMIPPYERRHRRVTFRPASNFRLTYNMNADPASNKTYNTDPEQNERSGWFSPDILNWGANAIYDYRDKEQKGVEGDHEEQTPAQGYKGNTNLIHIHSAEMDDEGEVRIGGKYISQELMPDDFVFPYMEPDPDAKKYNSFGYYLTITPFKWLEASYTCVHFKKNVDGYATKDRHFSVKINPIREKKYCPAIAVGADDFVTSDFTGEETRHQFFCNYWLAMTKHFDLGGHELGVTLGGRYYTKSSNKKYQGVNGAVTYRPLLSERALRIVQPRAILEYDGYHVNFGADALLWRHLLVQASLTNFKGFSAGIAYQVNLFYKNKLKKK